MLTLGAVALTGCSGGNGASGGPSDPAASTRASVPAAQGQPSTGATSTPAGSAVITTSAAKSVNPADPVTVSIAHGTLTKVTLVNAAGKVVHSALAAGGASWKTTEDLGYGKPYKLNATGTDTGGNAVSRSGTVSTVEPDNMTLPTI